MDPAGVAGGIARPSHPWVGLRRKERGDVARARAGVVHAWRGSARGRGRRGGHGWRWHHVNLPQLRVRNRGRNLHASRGWLGLGPPPQVDRNETLANALARAGGYAERVSFRHPNGPRTRRPLRRRRARQEECPRGGRLHVGSRAQVAVGGRGGRRVRAWPRWQRRYHARPVSRVADMGVRRGAGRRQGLPLLLAGFGLR
mmetsp:Transcript_98371/g.278188  ORF Transcript_98371/g.278188 Transcript_98371/m.278188 type:complete len:200 (-) Transcript_98371:463-1062(-)